jgi:hypothetical protein
VERKEHLVNDMVRNNVGDGIEYVEDVILFDYEAEVEYWGNNISSWKLVDWNHHIEYVNNFVHGVCSVV